MSGSASLDLERQMLSHTLAIAPMPTLARVYVALCETAPTEAAGGSELAGGGYARTAATFALMATPANAAANATAVDFAPATANWATITHFELWTQPAGGTRLYWGRLVDPADGVSIEIDVAAGDTVRFSPGSLVVQAAEVTAAIGIGPFLPTAGGEMTGPLDINATGGTAAWSEQDRWGAHLDARDFGIICDGVTDQGAQLNEALAAIPIGATLYIPSSIYTTQTILVDNGRRLVMDRNALVRPSVGSPLMECTVAIIGSAGLSPVVRCMGNESGLTGVNITRNGTPAAGSIGLQVLTNNSVFNRVYSYNHARCVQVGVPRAVPVNGVFNSLNTRFDHCIFWRGTEDFLYLINAPETTIYDCRFGVVGETDPVGATSLVCLDGDENFASSASTTNTVNFVRCQFNTAGGPQYSLRFHKFNTDGWVSLMGCYAGGAGAAFIYIDPNCTTVQHLTLVNNWIAPLAATETFLLDAGHKASSFEMIGNHIGGGPAQPAAGFSLTGGRAMIIGNVFNGPFTVRLDALAGGAFIGNSGNTMEFVGAYAGDPFIVSGNVFTNITQTATGAIDYVQPNAAYGQQLTLGKTGQAGRLVFRRGTDGAATAFVGINGASGAAITELSNTVGSPIVRLNAANTGGLVQFMANSVLVGQADGLGHTVARAAGTVTAPGAGFARLAFINGTTAGTAKLVAYAGTSTTPTTIIDNIGAGF